MQFGRTQGSFRRQLLWLVAISILLLAIIASLLTAWLASSRTQQLMLAQGVQLSNQLASQSLLSLLYRSQKGADDALNSVLAFPEVMQAEIYDDKGSLLKRLARGSALQVAAPQRQAEAVLVEETDAFWRFVAPVYSIANQILIQDEIDPTPASRQYLGAVNLVVSKSRLRDMRKSLILGNLTVGLASAVVLILLLNLGISRVLRPVDRLSKVMGEAEAEQRHLYAELEGPSEIRQMAKVFNRLMATLAERDRRLNDHREALEHEVDLRTRELVLARDAALMASRHKSEFIANISHELRTPLQSIIGYADVVREELELEGMQEQSNDLNRVLRNAQHLLTLINNILDLAKIEAGRMQLNLQETNIAELMQEAIEAVKPLMKLNDNRLEIQTDGRMASCELDRSKLLQILLNLLGNAAKFTRQGLVRLEASWDMQALSVSVKDTGIGIDAEVLPHIFEPFRQGDGSQTRRFEGTGLGLAICRSFCELMGGRIEVRSRVNEGSEFSLYLPLPLKTLESFTESYHSLAQAPQTSTLRPVVMLTEGYRVLIVDDDSAFLDLQARTLERAGYMVYTATSGQQALDLARSLQPDIITLDIQMPQTNGWQVLEQLKADPDLSRIPVVLISILDDHQAGLALGASEYLVKPVSMARVLLSVHRLASTKVNDSEK